ncbi:hypothetical protein [Aquibacillus sediminis]|uniref:hypothetical protein n=1 Tax=Aquibacillus sediminis TaxID=2574734 RepID=UPI001AED261F|nr:hypothetical protein [Aquibacillus sediminis]
MVENVFFILFLVPVYGLLIWSYFYPVETMLFGERWLYKKEPEYSSEAIAWTKFSAVVGMFVLTIIISSIFHIYWFRAVLVLGLFMLCIDFLNCGKDNLRISFGNALCLPPVKVNRIKTF